MNKFTRTLILLVSIGSIACAAQADTAFKPMVVDMNRIFEGHYKTEEAYVKINEVGQKVQEQLDQMGKQIQELAEQFQVLAEKSRDTVLKPEARAQAEAEAQKKSEDYQRLQAEAQKFRTKQQEQLQQRMKNHRDILIEEISQIVKNVAQAKGATIVYDKSVSPITGMSGIIYNLDSYDITDEVLKEANKDRPPPPVVPAANTPPPVLPAPAPTPAK